MRDNTARLARAYPNGCLVDHWKQAESAWLRGSQPFFDVELFLRHGEAEADALPHSWDVSSDSIAARLAARHNADLVLIKACPVPTGPHDWPRLAATGLVDRWFSRVAQEVARITLEQWPA
jgi:hypothetical protein